MKAHQPICCLLLFLSSIAAQREGQLSPELHAPFQILAGDKPIDVDHGHAAPFFADMDGDGLKDLLVGQFGEENYQDKGALRIYKNVGNKGQPRFEEFSFFQAGGTTGKVPTG